MTRPLSKLLAVFIFLTFSSSCTRTAQSVLLGKTSLDDLKKIKGEPARVDPLVDHPEAKSAQYPEGVSYQVEKNIVTAHVRPPSEQESTLQYWRHAWRNYDQDYTELKGSADHATRLYQLSAPEISKLVVYDAMADHVLYVVEYAK